MRSTAVSNSHFQNSIVNLNPIMINSDNHYTPQSKNNTNILPYINISPDDNVITQIFKESFEQTHYKLTEKVLRYLKLDGLPTSMESKLKILLNRKFFDRNDFLDALQQTLINKFQSYKEQAKETSELLSYQPKIFFNATFNTYNNGKELFPGNNSKPYDFLMVAGSRYKDRLEYQYNKIKILGMPEPIRLQKIYTSINILEKITSHQRITAQDLHQFFDRDKRGFGKIINTIDGITVINTIDKVIVLGKPGSGKSTFLKFITLQAINGLLKEKHIPIMVELKLFSDSKKPLIDYIAEQFNECHFLKSKPFLEYLLDEGKCIVLLDGLDEINEDRNQCIISEIQEFSNKYRKNKYVISCRIAAYNYTFQNFTDVEMADFNNEQINYFINCWFINNNEKASLCWKELLNNPPIKELASIPLLLTLLCLVFDEEMSFPKNRAELYDEAIEILLKKWDSSKNIHRQEVYKSLSLRRKENLLCKIAYSTFIADNYFLPKLTIENHIKEFICNIPCIKEEDLEIDSEAILKSIESQHGIFVERARNIYSFSHLTFQEYFTAKYIVDNNDRSMLERLINTNITEIKWREVFLLITGLLLNADHFLLEMKKKADSLIDESLAEYLDSVYTYPRLQEHIFEGLEKDKLGKHCINITNFFFAIASINAIASSSAFPIASAKDLSIASINAIIAASSFGFGIANGINHKTTFVYDPEPSFKRIIKLANNYDLQKKLEEYGTAYTILIECLTSECYISKGVRQKITSELCMLP